ncbi:general secretion pathway protein GspB [Shewanella insulae]|uniref:general secretion pathway protein GspB n=1 Tax=Shewanella insulae TaxID=2681496 RepID=UPI001EFCD514|nr:general secretion pathway protein GspB [Shewanella insulae]MCG9753842.1 general secretion pathway protein GspB [Shewanella insulae]
MSILLDAVTRAKQQDQQLDPVITPRAQYEAMQPKWPLAVKLGLLGTGLGGAIVLAWVLSGQGQLGAQRQGESLSNQQTTGVQTQASHLQQVVAEPQVAQPTVDQPPQADSNLGPAQTGIKLAGKVALPLAVERPSAQPQGASRPQVTSSRGAETVAASQQRRPAESPMSNLLDSAEEPIILGAKANQRGRELLSSLKAQVDEAAADVGLESAYAQEREQVGEQTPEPAAQQRPAVKDTSKLVAAFEAALKEVEKENAVATPVTQPKLDPIPAAQPDELPKYGQLPAGVQLQVPEFNILAHVYANDPKNRWLNVDGAELQQGDMIGGKLKIVEIRPRDVVLEVAGTEFKVPAI